MKKLLSLAVATIFMMNIATAQTERPTEEKPKTEKKSKKQDKIKLAKELNLTKEQMALKANDQITVKEMREKKAALKKEQEENMAKILTPEQKAKFETLKKDRKKGHGKHKKNKGAAVAPTTV
jgi:Spy/CpxP family protein refolding chaperone